MTVSASPVSPAVAGDFAISSNNTLTIAARQTSSTGTVTITGVDNNVDAPRKSMTVSAPSSRTLTITDDEETPTVTLELSSSSIGENGGSARVTASLSGPSSQAVTVVVVATPVPPAVSGDFTITLNTTLTIAARQTSSTGAVAIMGVDNDVDAPDKSVIVWATVSGGDGVSAPAYVTLTTTDDEAAPTVTLNLSSSSIGENGGAANVTASLGGASSQAATVVVSASPVSPAVSGYFTITSNKTLTIAPGFTSSTGTVTITSVDNSVDAPDKSISVRIGRRGYGLRPPRAGLGDHTGTCASPSVMYLACCAREGCQPDDDLGLQPAYGAPTDPQRLRKKALIHQPVDR